MSSLLNVSAWASDVADGSRPGRGFSFHRLSTRHWLALSIKRGIDVVAALLLLCAAAPLLALLVLAIRLESAGAAVIVLPRVGRHLRPFPLYKLRTMVDGADSMRAQVEAANQASWPLFKIRRDPRVTTVGRLLRRLSLDELPQLLNVLRGEMSLVGPRPPRPDEVDQDRLRQSLRLRLRPGLTGLWQVSGRSDVGYEDMLQLDLRYIREWSLGLDLAILLRTVPAVIVGRGAY